MRLRQVMDAALIECNKVKAPSMLLEDFIYLFNKAIQQYVNLVYNRAEYNQQSSDDLNFLQTVCVLENPIIDNSQFGDVIWRFKLPNDYLHLLNCKAEITSINSNKKKCNMPNYKPKEIVQCSRLTADLDAGITNNYYMKPSNKRPYYYIVNRNNNKDNSSLNNTDIVPSNLSMDSAIVNGSYSINNTEDHRTDMTIKENYDRTAHQSPVFIEIHAGNSEVNKIQVAYVKAPMYVSMTQDQVMSIEDTTQVLEFPDYICYEIINLFVRLALENAADPRLQTNIGVNQSIAIPGSK